MSVSARVFFFKLWIDTCGSDWCSVSSCASVRVRSVLFRHVELVHPRVHVWLLLLVDLGKVGQGR